MESVNELGRKRNSSGLGAMNYEGSNENSSTLVTGFTFRYDNGNNFNLAYGTLFGIKK